MVRKLAEHSTSRWEHGSEFHWIDYEAAANKPPWHSGASFFGCGRDALRALLEHGQTSRGWKRLWIPSYFCQEVVASMLSTGIAGAIYRSGPLNNLPDIPLRSLETGDVVLRINLFGLKAADPVPEIRKPGVEIIENHTHDPWSHWAYSSRADWCIVSLRKSLPIPDGGAVWSPLGNSLPLTPPTTSERKEASLNKLAGMLLKSLYLKGHDIDKDVFRQLAVSGENRMATGDPCGMPDWTLNMLPTFPIDLWREQRRANHEVLSTAMHGVPWLTVLQPDDAVKSCPYSAIILFDSVERRAQVRNGLIASSVYPTILWSLDDAVLCGISDKDYDFSRRMLSIHCDMRYQGEDMERVATIIRQSGEDCRG